MDGNATDALAALRPAQKKANAKVVADEAGVQVVADPQRVALKDAGKRFVQAALDRGSEEAAEIYERVLVEFMAGCSKTYADELKHEDVTKFHAAMRKRGLADRTIANHHRSLRAFLIYLRFDKDAIKQIAGPTPRYEKTLPEIYEPGDQDEPAELEEFFDSLESEYDQLLFDVLLASGLREQEVMHLEWWDLSKSRKTLKVQSKPQYSFKVKDAEERELPVPQDLMNRRMAYREKKPTTRLIFGAGGGEQDVPDGHLLRRLKTLVRKAGLNCGDCDGCKTTNECGRWFLHKFRATLYHHAPSERARPENSDEALRA